MTALERSWADEPRTRSLPHHTGRTTTMKHFTKSRVVTVAVASGAAVALAGGVAYAVWSVSGSGNGAAASGSSTALSIAGVAGTASLVPGGTADVKLLITNNNKSNVSITQLTLSNAGIAGFTDQTFNTAKSGCSTTGVTWAAAGVKTLATPIVVAANGGTYTLTLTNAASMDTTSDDGCQTTTFKMPVTAATATLVSTAASSPNSGSQN